MNKTQQTTEALGTIHSSSTLRSTLCMLKVQTYIQVRLSVQSNVLKYLLSLLRIAQPFSFCLIQDGDYTDSAA